MEYCSLDDAFGQPNQGGKNERRRKRCKGPSQTYIDPDPRAIVRQAPLPAMNQQTGLREHVPEDAQILEDFEPRNDGDPKQDIVRATLPTVVAGSSQRGDTTTVKPAFFGADPAENFASFTHVIGDSKEYRLQPEFQDAFREVGTLSGAGATNSLPTPSVRDVWKPLTPNGARSAFFEALPPPGGETPVANPETTSIHTKLDKLFSRLDELESSRSGDASNSQTEVLLFIMSGIFVLFLTDLAVRKGAAIF